MSTPTQKITERVFLKEATEVDVEELGYEDGGLVVAVIIFWRWVASGIRRSSEHPTVRISQPSEVGGIVDEGARGGAMSFVL